MKRISKRLFDSLVYTERLYWKDGAVELLPAVHAVALEIESDYGLDWLAVKELVGSIVRHNGFFEDASYEKIYEVLNVLGWEVSDEVKESESL